MPKRMTAIRILPLMPASALFALDVSGLVKKSKELLR
jgi:hypothetical protein